jgi:broad specificity phosphatase PhoE
MAEIILVRHGRTAYNREHIIRGRADVPLDDHGRRQAALLAEALAQRSLRAVHTSSLSRARETAEAIAARCGLPVEESPELIDIDFGQWQGQPWAEVERRWPDLVAVWQGEPGRFRAPEGESLAEVQVRAGAFVSRLAAEPGDGAIALVSHRVVVKAILCDVLGAGLKPFWRLRQDTAALSVLQDYRGQLALGVVNDRCHLRALGGGEEIDF